jgi:hypothetical protein
MSSRNPLISVAALTVILAGGGQVFATTYGLAGDSTFFEGCFDPCLCIVVWVGTPQGTMDVTLVEDSHFQQKYALENIDWKVPEIGWTIAGSGEYTILNGIIVTHQLTAKLSINGQAAKSFDSGMIPGGEAFPKIDIEIDANDKQCYDTVIQVVAVPLAPPGDLDGDGCVGQSDLGKLLSCYQTSDCGDLDGDSKTGQSDLGILLAHYGQGCP